MRGSPREQYDGAQLRARRRRLGLTARELAKRSGLDVTTVGRAERGDQPVRREVVARLERTLQRLESEDSGESGSQGPHDRARPAQVRPTLRRGR